MSTYAVDVRYPGVPTLTLTYEVVDEAASVGSMTVCGPDHTTLHLQVTADSPHEALFAGQRYGDLVAAGLGLDIRHALAAVPL